MGRAALNPARADGWVILSPAPLRTEIKLPFQLWVQLERGCHSQNVQKT